MVSSLPLPGKTLTDTEPSFLAAATMASQSAWLTGLGAGALAAGLALAAAVPLAGVEAAAAEPLGLAAADDGAAADAAGAALEGGAAGLLAAGAALPPHAVRTAPRPATAVSRRA